LDAADYFERNILANGTTATTRRLRRTSRFQLADGRYTHVFDGRNKVFFFGDYEGLASPSGVPHPVLTTLTEETVDTQLQELITDQSGIKDAWAYMPTGTI